LELSPENIDVLSGYGDFLYYAREDYQGAAEMYRREEEAGNAFRAAIHMAKANARMGRVREARRLFNLALEAGESGTDYEPIGSPCHYFHMGECWAGLGKRKKAVRCFEDAMEEAGDYPPCVKRECFEAAFALAELYLEAGDMARARASCEMTLKAVPDREYREWAQRHGFLEEETPPA